jgi:hypothetical protein
VLEEDILANVAETKLLAEALANAQNEERAQRQRDVEFSAVEGKLREAITDNKQLKATVPSLKRKVHEVQAAAHVAGLKERRAAVELHEEVDVTMGQEGSARNERRFAMPKAFTYSTIARVARDTSGLSNDCKSLASLAVTEGERLQAFVTGRLQRRFGDAGNPPKPRTQPTQHQQRRKQSAQQEQQQERQQYQPQDFWRGCGQTVGKIQTCCKRAAKRAVEDVEEF